MVSYIKFDSSSYEGICVICREPPKDAVCHEGTNGPKHPLCRDCAKKVAALCPLCKVKTDPNSLLTWTDKCITELKCITKDALLGATMGAAQMTGAITVLAIAREYVMEEYATLKDVIVGAIAETIGVCVGGVGVILSTSPELEHVTATAALTGFSQAAVTGTILLVGKTSKILRIVQPIIGAVGLTGLAAGIVAGNGILGGVVTSAAGFICRRFTSL